MMTGVERCEVPGHALLGTYGDGQSYVDCYVAEVPGTVAHAAFVEAFFTTSLFKFERALLGLLARRPSTDQDAKALAEGFDDTFAAWRVESRAENQLLLKAGRTRSWLMVSACREEPVARSGTRLYFGSAVIPKPVPGDAPGLGFAFHALLGFHRLYSRALLRAAVSRLNPPMGSGP